MSTSARNISIPPIIFKAFILPPFLFPPFRIRAYGVHIIMYFIRMTIFLPNAFLQAVAAFANAAVVKYSVQTVVQRLIGNAFVFITADRFALHSQNSAISRQNAAPGIFIIILFAANGNAVNHAGKIFIHKID